MNTVNGGWGNRVTYQLGARGGGIECHGIHGQLGTLEKLLLSEWGTEIC